MPEFEQLHPRGFGGRFATKQHDEATVDLTGRDDHGPTVDLLSADTDALWALVDSDEPADQVAASRALALSDAQAVALSSPERPFVTRLAVAGRAEPGHAARAAVDPDPVVRARALDIGFDLDDITRHRLRNDGKVTRVRELLGLAS